MMAAPSLPDPATLPPAGEGVQEMTTAPDVHGEEAGGLPQFDTSVWAGQIVYLLFLFFVLYLLVSKVFAPRLRRVMDERGATISTAIATARQVQVEAAEQAAAAKADVERARGEARSVAAEARARVAAEAETRRAAEEAEVAARIGAAEAQIASTRDAAMANVGTIAQDTAQAIVERLTGKAATPNELAGAKGTV